MGTCPMGYSFRRVDARSSFPVVVSGGVEREGSISLAPFTSVRSYQVTNSRNPSPFEGEIITFIGRNQIHFNSEFLFYFIQHRRFGIWHDIWIFPTHGLDWQFQSVARYRVEALEWSLEDSHEIYVLAAAIMNMGTVRNVGFIDNFFQVTRIPTIALLCIYFIYRRKLHKKSSTTAIEGNENT